MRSEKDTFRRCGILALIVCMLIVPVVAAKTGPEGSVFLPNTLSLPFTSLPQSADLKILQVVYYNRTPLGGVVRGYLPVKGGIIVINSDDVLTFRVTGKYTGPPGTFSMLDLYNPGTYPLNRTPRIDAVTVIPAGGSGTVVSPACWFRGITGNFTYYGEFLGNNSITQIPITIRVKPAPII